MEVTFYTVCSIFLSHWLNTQLHLLSEHVANACPLSFFLSLSLSWRRNSLLTLAKQNRFQVKKDVASPAQITTAWHVHWTDIYSNLKSSSSGVKDSLTIKCVISFYTFVAEFDGSLGTSPASVSQISFEFVLKDWSVGYCIVSLDLIHW